MVRISNNMQETAINKNPFYDTENTPLGGDQVDLPQFRRLLSTVGIVARPGLIESNNFISGSTGWQLTAAGDFEANSGTFRGNLSGATITGGTFQTASGTSQRMVITGSDNTLRFYDTSNNQVIGIGTTAGSAITMALTSVLNNGITATATTAGNFLSLTVSANIDTFGIQFSFTHASNSSVGIRVDHDGDGNGYGMLFDITNAANGIYIGNSGTGTSISLVSTNTTQVAINIISVTQSYAVLVENHATGGNPTGIKIDVDNSGGNGYAFEFAGDIIVTSGFAGTIDRKIRVLLPSGAVYYIYLRDG